MTTQDYGIAPVTEFAAAALEHSLYVGSFGGEYPSMDTENLFVAPTLFSNKVTAGTLVDPTAALPTSFSMVIDGARDANGELLVAGSGGILATGVVALGGGAIIPKYTNATGTMKDLGYIQVGAVADPITGLLTGGVSTYDLDSNIFKSLVANAVVPRAYVDAKIDQLLNFDNADSKLESIKEIFTAIGEYNTTNSAEMNIINTLGSLTTKISNLQTATGTKEIINGVNTGKGLNYLDVSDFFNDVEVGIFDASDVLIGTRSLVRPTTAVTGLNFIQDEIINNINPRIRNVNGTLDNQQGQIETIITTLTGDTGDINLSISDNPAFDARGDELPQGYENPLVPNSFIPTVNSVLNSLQQQLNAALYSSPTTSQTGTASTVNGVFADIQQLLGDLYGMDGLNYDSANHSAGTIMGQLNGYGVGPAMRPGLLKTVDDTQTSIIDTIHLAMLGKGKNDEYNPSSLNSDGTSTYFVKDRDGNLNKDNGVLVPANLPAGGLVGMALSAQADATTALSILDGTGAGPTFNNGATIGGNLTINPVNTSGTASLNISKNWRFFVPALKGADDLNTKHDDRQVYNMLQLQYNPNPDGLNPDGTVNTAVNLWSSASTFRAPRKQVERPAQFFIGTAAVTSVTRSVNIGSANAIMPAVVITTNGTFVVSSTTGILEDYGIRSMSYTEGNKKLTLSYNIVSTYLNSHYVSGAVIDTFTIATTSGTTLSFVLRMP